MLPGDVLRSPDVPEQIAAAGAAILRAALLRVVLSLPGSLLRHPGTPHATLPVRRQQQDVLPGRSRPGPQRHQS